MKRYLFLLLIFYPFLLQAQKEKVQRDPTHDDAWLHFGFSVGINTMDFDIKNSQMGIDSGIYTEVSMLRPGFHVHALSNLRLAKNFDLRFTPGIAFGGVREINYVLSDPNSSIINPADNPVKIESNFLEFPVLLKYKSKRLNNFRPFLIGGLNARVDLATAKKTWGRSRKEDNLVLLKPFDLYYEIGVGMDFYLEYDLKFAVEFKYSVGMTNVLRTSIDKGSETIVPPEEDAIFTNVIDKLFSRMFMITIHFE
ncbi:MAG: porin family protein [Bacteroidales bacterium]